MAKFTEGFLGSLRGSGQRGSATDPRLADQMATQYGSTDPLARSVGGMLNMDMSTGAELAQKETAEIAAPVGSMEHLKKALLVQAKYAPPKEQTLIFAKLAELEQAQAVKDAAEAKERTKSAAFSKYAEKNYPTLKPLVDAGVVDETNFNKFVDTSSEGEANSYSYSASGKVVDIEGNMYDRVVRRVNKGPDAGKVDVVLAPAPGSPEKPVDGKLTPVGGQFDQTPEEAAQLKGALEAEKGWGNTLASAVTVLPAARESRSSAQRALTLVQQLETGGFTEEIKKAATDFFGVTPTNKGEFAVLVQDMMVTKLGEAIKGNPTPREMDEIKKTMASVGKGKELNIAILTRAVDQLDRLISRSEYLMTPSATKEGYSKFITSQYEEDETSVDEETATYLQEALDRQTANEGS